MKKLTKGIQIVCPRMKTWKHPLKPNMSLQQCIVRWEMGNTYDFENDCTGCDFPIKEIWKLCGG